MTWPITIAALAAVGVVAALLLVWPAAGPVALLLGSLLVSSTVPFGPGLGFPPLFVAFLLGLWLCRLPWRRSPEHITVAPLRALAAFLWVAVLSMLVANSERWRFAFAVSPADWFALAKGASPSAQLGQLAIFALCVGTFLLVVVQVRTLRSLQILTAAFLVVGGLLVSCWIVPELRWLSNGAIPDGLMNGSLFWTWLVALAFSQAVFNPRLPPGLRIAVGVLVAGTLFVAAGENRDWVSGWVPPLVAVLAALWLGAPRLAAVATVAGAVALALTRGDGLSVLSFDNQYSLQTRLAAWRIAGSLLLANPLLGLGPANYYHYTVHFPILGWNVHFSSHNNFVDVVLQTGIAGLACLGWFTWAIVRLGWRLRACAPTGFARAYVIGALAGLAGTLAACMLGDWFLPFVYNTGMTGFRSSLLGWLFLGGLATVERASRVPRAAEVPQPSTRMPAAAIGAR